MDASFAESLQALLTLGLVDDRYPLDNTCVQMPNGWFGVDSILSGLGKIFGTYDYEEMLLPTISTKGFFKDIPVELKGKIEEVVFPITHTGKHKLDEPYFLSGRPELIVPHIVKLGCRSYRELPVRKQMAGFRYIKSEFIPGVSLATDTEYPALDVEGIFGSEQEYITEVALLTKEFEDFVREKLCLTLLVTETKYAKIFFAVLANGSVMEVARLRLYGQELAKSIGFDVRGGDNANMSPFIVSLNVTSKLFVAVVAAHSTAGKVGLPMQSIRAFCMSFGVDTKSFTKIRTEMTKLAVTQERLDKFFSYGVLFALIPAEDGKVEVKGPTSSVTLDTTAVEEYVLTHVNSREVELAAAEKAAFEKNVANAVVYVAKDAQIPEGFVAIGTRIGDAESVVAARLFLPVE